MNPISRHEHKIIIASAQALTQIDTWHAPADLQEELDWQYIYAEAIQHRTVPLLQYFLTKHPYLPIPQEISNSINQYVQRQTLANIFQTKELLNVLDRLSQENIPAIPFKGPTLGKQLYNELSFRSFGDLDILIHIEDFYKVKQVLKEIGYTPFKKLSEKQEATFLTTQMGYEFERHDKRCVIEIHWSLVSRIHSFEIPETELWRNSASIEIQNKLAPVLNDKHLFIYLCAHGTKSFWSRLRWISDIAELISIQSNKEDSNTWWSSVLEQADACNSRRMVHLGVYLAHKLLNAPAPPHIVEKASKDKHVLFLYNRVFSALFVPPDQKKEVLKPISFHLHMRERFKDKRPYLGHVLKLWLHPSKKDKAFLKLPERLNFLYLLLKPVRIVSQVFLGKTR